MKCTEKTIEKHMSRIKTGIFTKVEINALTKLFCQARFAKDEQKEMLMEFRENVLEFSHFASDGAEVCYFAKPCKIKKEQTLLGKQWLRNYFFKSDGTERKGKATENISNLVLRTAKNVKRFEFVGVVLCHSFFGDVASCLPIYRTYSKNGVEFFDYAPIHWGRPLIVKQKGDYQS